MSTVVEAAQAALAGEHACVFGLGAAGARLSGAAEDQALAALDVHRGRRDALAAQVSALGEQPVAALATYALPFPITDESTARELAGLLEQRLTAVYVDLVGAGPEPALRELAARAVIDAAVRATRWTAATSALPGLDERLPSTDTEASPAPTETP